MAETTSYLDKVFRQPDYIWSEGNANVSVIAATLENNHVQRCQFLASTCATDHSHASEAENSPPVAVKLIAAEPLPSGTNGTAVQSTLSSVDQGPSQPGATRNTVIPLLSLVWNGAEPQNYQAQFKIGTDPVPFLLDLDTGSSMLWVQASLQGSDPNIDDQSQYDPSASKTAKDAQTMRKVQYGDGDGVVAAMYSDYVLIDRLLAKDQQIGAVRSAVLSKQAAEAKSNGLIGLGFPSDHTNLVQTLQQDGAIRYASITLVGPRNDPSKAKEIDKQHIMEPRGYLIIGSVDEKFYTGELAWCPQVSRVNNMDLSNRWVVELDAVKLDGKPVLEKQYALIDTGTSYILTSPPNFKRFMAAIPRAGITHERYMFGYPKNTIKTVSFVLGGREIELHPEDMTLGDLHLKSDKNPWSLSSICTLLGDKWIFPENLWVLGGIFIDNVVTVFDYESRRIGFADISEHDVPIKTT